MIYRYSDRNLLNEKYHYNYTPFEGIDFLEAYFKQRDLALNKLRQKLHRSTDYNKKTKLAVELSAPILREVRHDQILEKRELAVLPSLPGDRMFETKEVLIDLLQVLILDPQKFSQSEKWVELFLKKFEVSKRLYAIYSADCRKASNDNQDIEIYGLFALVLAYLCGEKSNLRVLNTLLKVVDLATSADGNSEFADAVLIGAIDAEVRSVKMWIEKSGTSL